jgi:hypothetical protein
MIFEASLVRLFFEVNQFYVLQQNQGSSGLPKKIGEGSLIKIKNNDYADREKLTGFQIFVGDLVKVNFAEVLVRNYHPEKTYPKTFKNSKKLRDLLKKDIQKYGTTPLFSEQEESFLKILVVPSLPSDSVYREEIENFLKGVGVQAILSYRTIVENILKKVDFNKQFPKGSLLETLRFLKIYDLIKDPQLELFH